jgi:hypothetical protein
LKFVRIFEEEDCRLFAVAHESGNALTNLFKDWDRSTFVWKYFLKHENLLKAKFKVADTPLEFIERISVDTVNEAKKLYESIKKLPETYKGNPWSDDLDKMFPKLHPSDLDNAELRESRAYGIEKNTCLRIFSVRVETNCHLVTGGMIKLTLGLQDTKPAGPEEYAKLKSAKQFLVDNSINTREKLIEYINKPQTL